MFLAVVKLDKKITNAYQYNQTLVDRNNVIIAQSNGTLIECNKTTLNLLLNNFKKYLNSAKMSPVFSEGYDFFSGHVSLENIISQHFNWMQEGISVYNLSEISGELLLSISDRGNLEIHSEHFFKFYNDLNKQEDQIEYLSVSQYARLHEKSEVAVRKMLYENRIEGARLFSSSWSIPSSAPWPADKRKISTHSRLKKTSEVHDDFKE